MLIRRWTVVILAVAMAGGCGWRRDHLNKEYAASYDAAFSTQRQRVDKAPAQPAIGLDSQEAAIISDSYLRHLAPKDAQVQPQPTVLIAPPTRDTAGIQALPPSVPKS